MLNVPLLDQVRPRANEYIFSSGIHEYLIFLEGPGRLKFTSISLDK